MRELIDHLTQTHLRHQQHAPITPMPEPDITITDAGYTFTDAEVLSFDDYVRLYGEDPHHPITSALGVQNRVLRDRTIDELQTLAPEIVTVTEQGKALEAEYSEVRQAYRQKIGSGEYPSSSARSSIFKKLRKQKWRQAVQSSITCMVALAEGAQIFPALIVVQGLDPTNLVLAVHLSPSLVMSSLLFTAVCSFVFWGLGKQLVERVERYSLCLKSLSRVPLLSHFGVVFWLIAYILFVWALANLRQSLLDGTGHDAHTSLFLLTALVPIVSAVMLGKSSIDPSLVQEVEAREKVQESRNQAKQEHEAMMVLLLEDKESLRHRLDALLTRKNELLDIAEQAETKFRASFTQEIDSTVRFSRSLHLALEEAKHAFFREQEALHSTRMETTTTARRQSSMARIIELAKAHS